MKHLMTLVSLFSVFLLLLAACEKKCWQANYSDDIHFQLIDKVSKQDLVFGTAATYKLDSMQLNQSPDYTLGRHGNFLGAETGGPAGLITSTGNHPVETSYLRLTAADIDTITITYIYEANKCCTSYNGYGKISEIKYNGKVVTKNGDYYKYEKE